VSNAAAQREQALRLVSQQMMKAIDSGLIRLRVEDQARDGRTITVKGRELVNFGSAAYLGLNTDERLKEGARAAIDQYGTVFSSSAAYTSVDLYTALEDRLRKIFGRSVLIPSTTTLGHLSVLPVLVGPDDLVIMDRQVHASVQLTAKVLEGIGATVRTIPHNDVDILRVTLRESHHHHPHVWYLADGIYSMYGDTAPLVDAVSLLDEYSNLYLYFDDAHGTGWRGPHGIGHVFDTVGMVDRMVVIGSLAKSWGAGGSVLALPSEEMAERVLLAGATFTFSGPIHPAGLGAAVAAADIHLSAERDDREADLMARIDHVRHRLVEAQLPAMSLERTPLWFLRVGNADGALELGRRLMADGFYTNVSGFPVVPMGMDGIRFTTTTFQSHEDIDAFMDSVTRNIEGLVSPLEWHLDLRAT
jgi:7-keto-8-aminopelargonate synthetase-like enzyme